MLLEIGEAAGLLLAAVLLTVVGGDDRTADPPDPKKPFPFEKRSQMLAPPYRTPDLAVIKGEMSGPIHSPLAGGVFFRNPAYDAAENDGRLYYTRFLGEDPAGKPSSLGFVTWQQLRPSRQTAQRIVPIPTYTVEDFETDGQVLKVHHYPPWPYGKARIRIQIYRWYGDDAGNGEFQLAQTVSGPAPG
jgi:hypothetical protein